GRSVCVECDLGAPPTPLGFHCKPPEPDSPYRDIFFYAQGENAKETDEPLGAIMVQSGVLQERDIERRLAIQTAARRAIDKRLGEILVDMGLIPERELSSALAA